MTGAAFGADDALAWGLLNRIVPQDELVTTALNTASRIGAASSLAIRQVKQALNASTSSGLHAGYRREIELYRQCIHAPDRIEGLAAFNEKRAPEFGRDK
jgi:enoyl-CoA hydratase/carnithine racemase